MRESVAQLDIENLPELPKGWVWAGLGEITSVMSGGTPDTKEELNFGGDVVWITPADLSGRGDKYISHGARNITDRGLKSSSAVLLPKGSVIFSSRAPIGYVAIAATELCTNQGFKNFIPFDGLYNEYLYYYLKASKALAESFASGTTFSELSASRAANLPVPFPPTSEQHRIVAKIEELFTRLDAGVESLKKIKAQLKRYRQSVLKHAFEGKLTEEWRQAHKHELEPASALLERIKQERHKTTKAKHKELPPLDTLNLPKLPEGWVWTRVGNTSEMIQYGTSEKANGDSSGIPVIRMGNIQDGKLVLDELKYFPEGWPQLDDFILQEGDVLFNRTNSAELVGKTAVYKSFHPRGVFASYLIRVRVNANCYSPDMLSFFINSLHGRRYIASVVSQQVGQANVNGTKLSLMPIPVPPLAEQHQLVSEIERRFSVADEIEKTVDHSLKQAERLRQTILKRAFEGKLVPQDPNDEPAEKLLERIRQERARQQNERKPAKSSRNKSTTKQMKSV